LRGEKMFPSRKHKPTNNDRLNGTNNLTTTAQTTNSDRNESKIISVDVNTTETTVDIDTINDFQVVPSDANKVAVNDTTPAPSRIINVTRKIHTQPKIVTISEPSDDLRDELLHFPSDDDVDQKTKHRSKKKERRKIDRERVFTGR